MKSSAEKFNLFVVIFTLVAIVAWIKVGYEFTRADEYLGKRVEQSFWGEKSIETTESMIWITGSTTPHYLVTEDGTKIESVEVYPGYYGINQPIESGKWKIELSGYDSVKVVIENNGSPVRVGKNHYEWVLKFMLAAMLVLPVWIVGLIVVAFLFGQSIA